MAAIRERVRALQNRLKELNLHGYVVPSADAHQSEYVAEAWKRREYISGFSGSAGLFACTQEASGVWTDSRYWSQAEGELKDTGISLHRQGAPGVLEWKDWFASVLPKGSRVGLNPHLFSMDQFQAVEATLKANGLEGVLVDTDLVDQVWGAERPAEPTAPLREHPLVYAGESVADKLKRLRTELASRKAQGLLVSALDEVAWLFNLRGGDVDYNPVFYAFALVTDKQATIFVDPRKVTPDVRQALGSLVTWAPYSALADGIKALSKTLPLWLDPKTTSEAVANMARSAGLSVMAETSVLPKWKAAKNAAEIEGFRKSHVRDGVAMVKFFRWLRDELTRRDVDEMTAADKLEAFRQEGELYRGASFATIAGYGGNGALPHYRSTPATNQKLKAPGIFLLDSGGQYDDGTTDITRTIALGSPAPHHKDVYTRVLKGHLQLARTEFPQGTTGFQLDVLARQPLWRVALDYGHGTGHGVGAALCVHEGPFSVSQRFINVPLAAGNVLSNEPACYFVGEFGVRIENLLTVVPSQETAFGRFLKFENLTLCPYDHHLIAKDLLTHEEIEQVDAYHRVVKSTLAPFLFGDDLAYLDAMCAPL
jgi:Xaa-Pro aminopeptidase